MPPEEEVPSQPLDHVVEQLWDPAFARSGDLRAAVGGSGGGEWQTVEEYWLIPRASTARLLVPRRPRAAGHGALTNYRRLRTPGTNFVRATLGLAARAGFPLSPDTVAVQVRRGASAAADLLPLAHLSAALGLEVFAATGVRTSDNRKCMLHLVDAGGRPVGFAKLGWNAPTDALVAAEADTLAEVGGREGAVRAPRLLARFEHLGHPVSVAEPLPHDVRGSLARVAPLTPHELHVLMPVVRHARVGDTAQHRAVARRLERAAVAGHVRELALRAREIADVVGGHRDELPVTARWHGDLAPWNVARDGAGRLWVWDWESSERDAVGGLDALHWSFSAQRLTARDVDRMSLGACLQDARRHLVAVGLAPDDRDVVAAHYAVTVVERACTLARHSGTWDDAFIAPDGLDHLLDQAAGLLGARRSRTPVRQLRATPAGVGVSTGATREEVTS